MVQEKLDGLEENVVSGVNVVRVQRPSKFGRLYGFGSVRLRMEQLRTYSATNELNESRKLINVGQKFPELAVDSSTQLLFHADGLVYPEQQGIQPAVPHKSDDGHYHFPFPYDGQIFLSHRYN